ncbi:trichohyalin-like [Bactrocera oleae]|uniref:trichohyalin-like n=1 Tax=Bactrocera oleae TaxID=104688 RepID=UPI00387EBAFE
MSQTSPWFMIAMQAKRKLENDKETSNSKRRPNVVKKPIAQTPTNRTTCESKDIAPPQVQEPEWVLVSNKTQIWSTARRRELVTVLHVPLDDRTYFTEQQRNTVGHSNRHLNPEYRAAEQERNTIRHLNRRLDPEYRAEEQERNTAENLNRRTNPEYRAAEQERNTMERSVRRQNAIIREEKRQRDAALRKSRREDPIKRRREQILDSSQRRLTRQQTRQQLANEQESTLERIQFHRSDPAYRQLEREPSVLEAPNYRLGTELYVKHNIQMSSDWLVNAGNEETVPFIVDPADEAEVRDLLNAHQENVPLEMEEDLNPGGQKTLMDNEPVENRSIEWVAMAPGQGRYPRDVTTDDVVFNDLLRKKEDIHNN